MSSRAEQERSREEEVNERAEQERRHAEDENHTSPLGSDTWSNEPRYENIYRARLDFVLNKVSEAALQELVSSLRNGMRCTISRNYAAGNFNLVKKIVFEDDVQWIIRIRLPPLSYFMADTPRGEASYSETEVRGSRVICTERDLESLKSEFLTMKYLRAKTTIPIPRIYAYSLQNDNTIGFPYIIMDYIHGTTAFHLSAKFGNPLSIPARYLNHYYTQVTKITRELASLQFALIGSLTGDPDSVTMDEVKIGPIAETGEGPYETAQDFYTNYPAAIAGALYSDPQAPDSGGCETIRRLPGLLQTCIEETCPQEVIYSLTNLEMGTHNILVNNSFDILAVIDWDTVIAALSAVRHQFPWCIGGDPGIPGIGPIKAFGEWEERLEMCRVFAAISERSIDEEVKDGKERLFSAAKFFSKEALAFRALAFFRIKQS
ncbi:uncharacterized protein LY89DRAFT_319229 [Mollisia scopiformis]|uniref:Aminoglycoside phosphotransferase domain-containing protein n=1 Tax=Mollisia scopiformis TaxID=149040 RepID=A0A132B9J4_MOLSC|nr:uncharacterized protein LY89DRAFT_319229 [Mollisia scopiformis]KUJ09076.1 hypothetical protein LY89DRAFT_319229 [Mollisia scopiformis]